LKYFVIVLLILSLFLVACSSEEKRDEHGCLISSKYVWDQDLGVCAKKDVVKDENIRKAIKIAVAPLSYIVTVKNVLVARCEGCYVINFERNDNYREVTINLQNWKIIFGGMTQDEFCPDVNNRLVIQCDDFIYASLFEGKRFLYRSDGTKVNCPIVQDYQLSDTCKYLLNDQTCENKVLCDKQTDIIAEQSCGGKDVYSVEICGDFVKIISNLDGGGVKYISYDNSELVCPVVAPNSISEDCKKLVQMECRKVC